MRRASYDEARHKLALETFFLACLGAAKSAEYYLRDSASVKPIRDAFLQDGSVRAPCLPLLRFCGTKTSMTATLWRMRWVR